jgi:hypothetical protein
MARRWHDGLKVGIDQIDEDHRHLFSILAALDDLIHSGLWSVCESGGQPMSIGPPVFIIDPPDNITWRTPDYS